LGYVGIVVGGVALGAGIAVGLWANATASKEKASTSAVDKPALRDAAYGRATAADITMAAGVLIVAASVVYLAWPRNNARLKATSSGLFWELPL
jgi:hypothetical protein